MHSSLSFMFLILILLGVFVVFFLWRRQKMQKFIKDIFNPLEKTLGVLITLTAEEYRKAHAHFLRPTDLQLLDESKKMIETFFNTAFTELRKFFPHHHYIRPRVAKATAYKICGSISDIKAQHQRLHVRVAEIETALADGSGIIRRAYVTLLECRSNMEALKIMGWQCNPDELLKKSTDDLKRAERLFYPPEGLRGDPESAVALAKTAQKSALDQLAQIRDVEDMRVTLTATLVTMRARREQLVKLRDAEEDNFQILCTLYPTEVEKIFLDFLAVHERLTEIALSCLSVEKKIAMDTPDFTGITKDILAISHETETVHGIIGRPQRLLNTLKEDDDCREARDAEKRAAAAESERLETAAIAAKKSRDKNNK